MTTGRRQFLGGIMAAAAAGGARAEAERGVFPRGRDDTLVIAHCGDPQFGFITSQPQYNRPASAFTENYKADLRRLEAEIEILNDIRPDLVYFTGDMTQNPEDVVKDWPRLLKKIKSPVLVTPGNHDMANNLTAANEDRFRDVFGYSYMTRDVKGWRIIAGNSQYWMPTKETARKAAYEEWFARALADARPLGGRVIVATHIPPFSHEVFEKGTYHNHSMEGRVEYLDSCLAAGVRLYLAGHSHRYSAHGYRGMEILNVETTCCNFDFRPFGFRLLKLAPDGMYSWNFVKIG